MRKATQVIRVSPDTMKRFKGYIGPLETADKSLNAMLDLIDQLAEDMGY